MTSGIERRFLTLETRADESDSNLIVGYAAVFYRDGDLGTQFELVPGRYIERFAPGAFDESLLNDDILCLFNHERSNVLGRNKAGTLSLSVDSKGLIYRCNLPDTTCGRDTKISLQRRDVTGSSIGFVAEQVTWTEIENGPTIRLIERAKLYDVSPVTYPAYSGTSASMRSAVLSGDLQAEIEKRDQELQQRRSGAAQRQATYRAWRRRQLSS